LPLLMVFIDGVGLGVDDPKVNPLIIAEMPFIRSLLSGMPLSAATIKEGWITSTTVIKPTDASLNTAGLPQSATGQTSLFTGLNAATIAGRHISGFPTKLLRELLRNASIFKMIHQTGRRAVFANTFTDSYFETVERGKWRHSVTTTAALAGGCRLLMPPDLMRGESIYQDITNERLRESGYEIPLFEPEEAAANLVKVAAKNDFTLFEYFQTDRCGHRQDYHRAVILLNRLDRFLAAISAGLEQQQLTLMVVSDHGNIEDLGVKTHTLNRVPTITLGGDLSKFEKINSLLDIYPAVLDFLGIHFTLIGVPHVK
jgi:2,3-bisphosphoglycerate-independent phosphoglycerate mutase